MRVHDELTSSVETISGVQQACFVSSFLFNFVMDKVIEEALGVVSGDEEKRPRLCK